MPVWDGLIGNPREPALVDTRASDSSAISSPGSLHPGGTRGDDRSYAVFVIFVWAQGNAVGHLDGLFALFFNRMALFRRFLRVAVGSGTLKIVKRREALAR